MSAIDFIETPGFPVCPSFGYSSRPDYLVGVNRARSGHEQRNRFWQRALRRFDVTAGPRLENEIYAVLEFWHAMGGMECGFRFRDYSDYKSGRVGDPVTATDQPLALIGGSDYQLVKQYAAGVRVEQREIVKPVPDTVLVADDLVLKDPATDFTVDTTTGIVTLNFTPVGALTSGFEFDVPARFDSEFPVELIEKKIEQVSFALMELRL